MQGNKLTPAVRRFPQKSSGLTGFLIIGLVLAASLTASGQSAKRAAYSLPEKYRDRIVKIAGEATGRDPAEWSFVCRAAHSEQGLTEITVRRGKIAKQETSPEWRVPLSNNVPIALERVLVDSRGAHEIARRYVSQKGGDLGASKFTLEQADATSDPVWSVWCFAPDGSYLGLMKLLAPTGDVVFFE